MKPKDAMKINRENAEKAAMQLDSEPPVRISGGLGEPHLTLTMEEIRDLAQSCGMVIQEPTASEREDERETEIRIAAWPKKGVWDDEQKCQVPPHKHIAYFNEYPEEGVMPLGSPNASKLRQDAHEKR